MILDKRVKSQGFSKEEHNYYYNWYVYKMNHYGATHPT